MVWCWHNIPGNKWHIVMMSYDNKNPFYWQEKKPVKGLIEKLHNELSRSKKDRNKLQKNRPTNICWKTGIPETKGFSMLKIPGYKNCQYLHIYCPLIMHKQKVKMPKPFQWLMYMSANSNLIPQNTCHE